MADQSTQGKVFLLLLLLSLAGFQRTQRAGRKKEQGAAQREMAAEANRNLSARAIPNQHT